MSKLDARRWSNLIVTLSLVCGAAPALAQSASSQVNDFFGSNLPNQQLKSPDDSSTTKAASPSSGLVPAPTSNGASPTDFTADEKRVQKKIKEMDKHIRGLIEKGDRMMKDGQARKDDKMFKKGKILKDIGEKQLAERKALAEQQAESMKAEKEKADGT
ncbi:MAG: hypothetical protein JSS86_24305 [Cyanobacteria bacterium SZAS LIN-2]|nr:hypothetical protein [Cyanobacteria bacterium SZAS LIN-3]MBS1999481.1 hypothetical protein [Cyanobacteria bacterium SZAS LIN-2]MBS2009273.1 hypothetical protein [Cyanobacteria bacterium SZAS TMP-1]